MRNKFWSRKFHITAAALTGAFVLALLGKLTGDFATIAAACVVAYNAAQGFIDHKNAGK